MIVNEKKKFLKQAYRLDDLIRSNQEELNRLREMSTSIGSFDYSKDRVQSSSKGDAPFANQVMQIIELEREINRDIDQILMLKKIIRDAINQIEDVNERLLLRHRYLNFMSWEDICAEMQYSIRSVHRIHKSALENFIIPR